MKRQVLIAVVLMCASPAVLAQPKEFYQAKIIIQGGWGTTPGQYGRGLVGDDQAYPTTFAVDAHENIYVLDDFNNRVQHYDSNGNLLGVIPITSYAVPTKEQKYIAGSRERSVGIGRFEFIDNTLYVEQEFYFNGPNGRSQNDILKLGGNQFVRIDSSTEAAKLLHQMSYASHQTKMCAILANDPNFHQRSVARGSLFPTYDGLPFGDLFVDGNNNRWVTSAVRDGSNRKYSPSGELLLEFKSGNSVPHITSRGDYYILSLFPSGNNGADNIYLAQGIAITKYSPK